jgi:dUTPase
MRIEEIDNTEYDRLCKERNAKRGAGGFGSSDKKLGK